MINDLPPEDLILIASFLAIYLSSGKTEKEIRTIINIVSLTAEMLDTILKQRKGLSSPIGLII